MQLLQHIGKQHEREQEQLQNARSRQSDLERALMQLQERASQQEARNQTQSTNTSEAVNQLAQVILRATQQNEPREQQAQQHPSMNMHTQFTGQQRQSLLTGKDVAIGNAMTNQLLQQGAAVSNNANINNLASQLTQAGAEGRIQSGAGSEAYQQQPQNNGSTGQQQAMSQQQQQMLLQLLAMQQRMGNGNAPG